LSQVEFREYLSVLRARWVVVVGCILLGVVFAALITVRAPKVYSARASVFFSVSVSSNTRDLSSSFSYVEGLVGSYAEVATQPVVLTPVINQLGLETTPKALARSVSTETPLDTVILDILVVNASPQRASDIANAVARQLSSTVGVLGTGSQTNANNPVRVTVVSPAVVPSSPSSPRTALNIVIGLLGGALLGVVAAFVRDAVDARIGGRHDVQRITDVPVIGVISGPENGSLRRRWFPGRRIDSEDRAKELRTNFQHIRVAHRLRSVVFTSAQHDRATSLTVSSLAVELAHAGIRTVLVDADLRKPTLALQFDPGETLGLSSVLLDNVNWRDVVQHRARMPLSVLPAGLPPGDPSAVLRSGPIGDLIADLANNYDVVLVKAPPVLRVADGLMFSRIADGTVVVADGPRMHRKELAEEVHVLEVADARVLGIVLTT
jgi:succinoglycan biosynthesis transport protein ExoP